MPAGIDGDATEVQSLAADPDDFFIEAFIGQFATALVGDFDTISGGSPPSSAATTTPSSTCATHELMGARFWTGRTRIDQAELHLTRRAGDDVELARDHLGQAQRIVDEYGLAGLQLRIDRLTANL